MASDGGDQQQNVDRECACVLIAPFPIFFVSFILYAIGEKYDDLSEAGTVFWSKLTLYNITDVISVIRFTRGAF